MMFQQALHRFWKIALAGAMTLPAAQAQDVSQAEVRATQLTPTTWMLVGAGGNIGLSAGADAVFVIDDQFAPLAPKIKAAIARITPKPVQFVLNTHYHYDHTGGNEAFGSAGALIVAHDNVRRRLSSEQLIGFFNQRQAATPKAGLPVVTVPAEIRFHINEDELHAWHAPNAHTDGDLIVHFRNSDVVHMGDVFFNGSYPFIDGSAGGTPDGVIAAMDRVLAVATDKTRIIPGHGPLATKTDLKAQRDMLAAVTQRIKDLRKAGRSDTQIVAAKPAADYDAAYGQGFIKPEPFVLMLLGAMPR